MLYSTGCYDAVCGPLAVTSSMKQVLLLDLWAEGDDRELDSRMRSRISVSTDGRTCEADGHKSGLILAFY